MTTKELVKKNIKWNRKGMNEPNYLHSYRVYNLLRDTWIEDKDVLEAGLLHDIIEDSDMTFKELWELGYSNRTIELVKLCSHNKKNPDKLERWKDMMDKVILDKDAFMIKLADIADNIKYCHLLSPDKYLTFVSVKGHFFLRYGKRICGDTKLYKEFVERYMAQTPYFVKHYPQFIKSLDNPLWW